MTIAKVAKVALGLAGFFGALATLATLIFFCVYVIDQTFKFWCWVMAVPSC